jgi:hypothetical protein
MFSLKIAKNFHCKEKKVFLTMVGIYTFCCKALATGFLTSLFSIFLYSVSTLAKDQTLKSPKTQLSHQQQILLKCGYKKKEITLKFPSLLFRSPKPELQGNRVEENLNLRCAGYIPPIPLTALIPNSNTGITLSGYPTFLFYIPDANLEGVEGEFVLYNEKDEKIYTKNIILKEQDSDNILSVELPGSKALPPLEIGKSYYWVFSILFDKVDRSANSDVVGWIKRIEPNSELKHKLETAVVQEKPAIYAANGIWYEALSSLAKLRCSAPNNVTLASDWQSLLQQVGLPEIATKPLTQCN